MRLFLYFCKYINCPAMRLKIFISCCVAVVLIALGGCNQPKSLVKPQAPITILYDNDVHCAVDGYAAMAALKQECAGRGDWVLVVSCGDYLSGSVLGSVSRGDYIVRVMNTVGYDFVTLGNHEFDFTVPRLMQNAHRLGAQVLCSNFKSVVADTSIFPASAVAQLGKVKVGFVGVATPSTMTTSSASYFKNERGEFEYSFGAKELAEIVQTQVDDLRKRGVDYVVLLAHLGDDDAPRLVAQTAGVDVILDGHSHSVIPQRYLTNKRGERVIWSSTGAMFNHIGALTIMPNGEVSTRLIASEGLPLAQNATWDTINYFKQRYDAYAQRLLGRNEVRLMANKSHDDRPVRRGETNMGDFCADAMRVVMGAQICLLNGGSIRANLEVGEVTFNDLYKIFPFNNQMCVASIEGQDILNALEIGARSFPSDAGGFFQVSGLRYAIDSLAKSGVEVDEFGVFAGVNGNRRISDVMVLNGNGEYEPLDPNQRYTVASSEYVLKACGDGVTFPSIKMLQEGVCLDVTVLERYLTEYLNGRIGGEYNLHQQRILIKK